MTTFEEINLIADEIAEESREELIDILYDEMLMEHELQRQYEMMSYEEFA